MYKIIVSEITTTSQLQDPVSISDVPILCLTSRPTWREFCLLIFSHIFLKLATKKSSHGCRVDTTSCVLVFEWWLGCDVSCVSSPPVGLMQWKNGVNLRKKKRFVNMQNPGALFAYDVCCMHQFLVFQHPPLHFLSQLLLIQILAYLVTWPLGCFVTTTTCCYGGCGILLCSQVLCGTLRDLGQYFKSRWHSPCISFFFSFTNLPFGIGKPSIFTLR